MKKPKRIKVKKQNTINEKEMNSTNNEDKKEKKKSLLKNSLSNLDIYVLSRELNATLKDGFIQNIYELNINDTLLLKCRTKEGKKNIIIDPKKRINFTQFNYPVPPFPSQFIMSLRKYMKGRRIECVYQHNLDRILVFQLKSTEGKPWKFIIELFAGGNFILIDGENKIYMAKKYKKMKDRNILPKKEYIFPPSRGIDLLELDKQKFFETLNGKKGELVRILARSFNIGGYIAEEICMRAEIDKKTPVETIEEKTLEKIYNVIEEFIQQIKNEEFTPMVILDEDNTPIGFEAFELKYYENYKKEYKESFSQCIDEVFARIDSELLYSGEIKETKTKLTKAEKILQKQLEKIEESTRKREETLTKGHLIYQYLNEIDSLISTIMTQKREKKRDWKEIEQILLKGKKMGIKECQIFEKLYPKEVKLEVNLDGAHFKLDLRKSAIENAEELYKQAKKAKKKIIGAKAAAEKTKIKIEQQKEEHELKLAQKTTLLKKPKQKWFEKYRWFISSDGFLVVGGRDASSNEAIVKKHMGPHDLFFHSDVRGAAVCIIQNPENKTIPENTIKETAIFASCYSSAWKQGWGSVDIYYVHPNQVSKTPKAGEYLKKGSFYITGKKNYLPKPYLELAIGLQLIPIEIETGKILEDQNALLTLTNKDNEKEERNEEEEEKKEKGENKEDQNKEEKYQYYPRILAGPPSAIQKQTPLYIKIRPIKKGATAGELAKKIHKILVEKTPEPYRKWVKLLSLNEIIRVIPPGNADIVKE